MSLDPEIAALFGQVMKLVPPPDFASLAGVAEAEYLRSSRRVSRPATTPEHVSGVEDRRVSERDVPVRIYRPDATASTPALVYLHGGGWVNGDLDTHDATCRFLANRLGVLVVNVDYCLAPEHPYPEPLDDAWAVWRWTTDHAEELGVGRVGIAGSSAGGDLAAAVALRARTEGRVLALQVLVYPVLDSSMSSPSYETNGTGFFLTKAQMQMQWYWRQYVPDWSRESEPEASPAHERDLGGVAPAVIVTAEYDPLRDEGERYADSLRAAGVAVTLERAAGLPHGFLGFAGTAEAATAARERIACLVDAALARTS